MKFFVKVTSIFDCSLERAFKTPILCDITKVHTGFLFSPKVTHTTEDADWGKVNASKKVYVAKSITQRGGFIFIDKIIERVENKYWKLEINEFQVWALGFYKFEGQWKTTQLEKNKILIEYSYNLYSKMPIFYPVNWLFTKIFWRIYMKKVMENIKVMAYQNEPYQYE